MIAALFLHWSAMHALSNAAGVALFGWLIVRREGTKVLVLVLALAFAFQTLVLSTMSGEYRGASGFLYALATYTLLGAGQHRALHAVIAVAGIAHVVRDVAGTAVSPFLPAGVVTAWPVHLAGIAAAVVARRFPRWRAASAH